MVNFILSLLLLTSSITAKAESFEGSIELVYKTCYDISYFKYLVKDKNVRIDKFDENHTLIQSMLVNIEDEQVFILNPSKKLYTRLEISEYNENLDNNFAILKTENTRMVNGYQCYQWRVKNIERNTEIAYWVSQSDFYFFDELIKLLNRTDNTYEFFEKIPESQGFFPMLSVERTLLRREKSRISVLSITNESINDVNFSVPSDFEMLSR